LTQLLRAPTATHPTTVMAFGRTKPKKEDSKTEAAKAEPTGMHKQRVAASPVKTVMGRETTNGGRTGILVSGGADTPNVVPPLSLPVASDDTSRVAPATASPANMGGNAEEEKAAKEKAAKEKAAAEKLAAEVAAAEREAAARKAAEAKAAEEEVHFLSELAKMTSVEAFGAQLSAKLNNDLDGLRKQIEKGKREMEATEAEIKSHRENLSGAQEANGAALGALHEECESIKAILRLVTSFEAESNSIEREAKRSHETLAQEREHTQSVRLRIEKELGEAQLRLNSAQEQMASLEREMADLKAKIEPAEKASLEELSSLTDEAIAKRHRAHLARRLVDVYQAEADSIKENETAVQRHAAKSAHAEEARASVRSLKEQLAVDDEKMAALSKKDAALEQAGIETQARRQELLSMLKSQLELTRQLAAKQEAFLNQKLLDSANTKEQGTAEATLLNETIAFVRAQLEQSQRERSKLESEIAAQETEAAAATSRLQLEIRQVRAESKAVAIAKEHRKKFFAEKMVQLEAAEREEAEAAKGIEGRMPCLDMIREELESCRKNYAQLEEQAELAERAKEAKIAEVEEQKADNRSKLSALSRQLASERSVVEEHRRYIASVEERHKTMQCVERETADGPGRLGLSVIQANAQAARTYVAELKSRQDKCVNGLTEAKLQRDREARRAEAELRHLEEQKATMEDALQKLAAYEASLTHNLASLDQGGEPGTESSKVTSQVAEPGSAPHVASQGSTSSEKAEMSAKLAGLRELRSSASLAVEASRVIDRISSNRESERCEPSDDILAEASFSKKKVRLPPMPADVSRNASTNNVPKLEIEVS